MEKMSKLGQRWVEKVGKFGQEKWTENKCKAEGLALGVNELFINFRTLRWYYLHFHNAIG